MQKQLTIVFSFLLTIKFVDAQEEYTDGKIIRSQAAWKNESIEKESAVDDYIHLYQKYISGNRGSRCAMYPSCSNYGLMVFRQTNFFNAMQLTSERLLRCGHERNLYNLTFQRDGFRLLDFPPYAQNPDSLIYKNKQNAFAYSDTKNNPDKELLFIQNLINESYYNEALLEINRLQFFQKRSDPILLINKMICMRRLDMGEKAIFEFETKFSEYDKKDPRVILQASLAYYDLKNYKQAYTTLGNIAADTLSSDILSQKYRLQALSMAGLGEWSHSQKLLSSADKENPNSALANRNAKMTQMMIDFKPKKSTVASLMSVVPGLGYLYTGHKQTALTAFVINGLLGYATYSSIKNKNYGVAALVGVFNASFYIGNILGSGQSAHRYNGKRTNQILNQLEKSNLFNY